MNLPSQNVKRFYSLDPLRGVAALTVVFWHWQHFYFIGGALGPFDRMQQPFAPLLRPFYNHGEMAVDLFFCLSGFIFYWLYATRIHDKAIGPGTFASLRFSRLYPLHFVTLIAVAVLQVGVRHAQQTNFVYQNNDLKHFLAQLLFASSWGIIRGSSFNGPTWSVSVEVLMYVCFFLLCRLFRVRFAFLFALALIGWFGIERVFPAMGRGVGSFFIGGCVYLAYQAIAESPLPKPFTKSIAYMAIAAWIVTLFYATFGLDTLPGSAALHQIRYSGVVFDYLSEHGPVLFVFPLTILALALSETQRGTLGKRISGIGDISYSTYLLHFPLQIVFYSVVVLWLGQDRSVFFSPWMMLGFFALLIPLALGSYYYLEVPAQARLRRLLLTRRAGQTKSLAS